LNEGVTIVSLALRTNTCCRHPSDSRRPIHRDSVFVATPQSLRTPSPSVTSHVGRHHPSTQFLSHKIAVSRIHSAHLDEPLIRVLADTTK
jgi:hypothetical protein